MKLIAVCATLENCDLIFCCSQKHLTEETFRTAVIILHATVCFAFESHEKASLGFTKGHPSWCKWCRHDLTIAVGIFNIMLLYCAEGAQACV